MGERAVVLFTRDLRVHDNAALAAAARECGEVVPLFVFDPHLGAGANRTAFLVESLGELRASLDGGLVVRRGEPAAEVAALKPDCVYVSDDVSPYARARLERLRAVAPVQAMPGTTVVPAGAVAPKGSDHYRVFTPYWRAWRAEELGSADSAALPLRVPRGIRPGRLPGAPTGAPDRAAGGERVGLEVLRRFLAGDARRYAARRDLPALATSRLSPYLHFGCVSPAEVVRRAARAGVDELVRQLCWRDFFAQLVSARPGLLHENLKPAPGGWLRGGKSLAAWTRGETGYPIVDAGMRQLLAEGWMHNRVRMIVASFLTKDLLVDWRLGAAHFMEHLVDGDAASNAGNWQWVAGTGSDTRPSRMFNPTRQSERFDRDGDYIRRYVPELAGLRAPDVHAPDAKTRRSVGYPAPIVDHAAAVERYRRTRLG